MNIQQPGQAMPPFANARGPQDQIKMLWEALAGLEQNQNQLVEHINRWVAKLNGVDSVAFAAIYLLRDKEVTLTPEGVEQAHTKITEVLNEMKRYADEQKAKADTAQAAAADSPIVPENAQADAEPQMAAAPPEQPEQKEEKDDGKSPSNEG